MKRFSPAVLLAAAAACVILLDAVVVVVPQVLAESKAAATASAESIAAAASPWATAPPEATLFIPQPDVPDPAATPMVTAAPVPTKPPAAKPTPKPKYRDTVANARLYVKSRIGTTQYNCIDYVWHRESSWNPTAGNPTSGAYGIPQAVPGSKMAAYGSNWRTSPLTQVKWGIWYVNNRYKSACGALAFWQANGWY